MTVGELANIRHYDADTWFRFDAGQIGAPGAASGDYIKAIALLASLGDWVTVRSHVFTVYGVLRGQEDETLEREDLSPDELIEIQAAVREVRVEDSVRAYVVRLKRPIEETETTATARATTRK